MARRIDRHPRRLGVVTAFLQLLAGLGWIEGRNIAIDRRFGGNDTARIRGHARELVALRACNQSAGVTIPPPLLVRADEVIRMKPRAIVGSL
jgi:hypothetical protein